MLIGDCLAKVIQLVSRNTLKVEDFKDCETTCDVLDTFVNKYPANVIFTGKLGDTTVTSSMTVVVKNAKVRLLQKVVAITNYLLGSILIVLHALVQLLLLMKSLKLH